MIFDNKYNMVNSSLVNLPKSSIAQEVMILLIEKPLFLGRIAEEIDKDNATVFNSIKSLLSERLIEEMKREDVPRHIKYYKLTERGKEIAEEIKKVKEMAESAKKKANFKGFLVL